MYMCIGSAYLTDHYVDKEALCFCLPLAHCQCIRVLTSFVAAASSPLPAPLAFLP